MNKPIYRNVYLGSNRQAVELQRDIEDLSRAVDISISRQAREFFRELVEQHRIEIDVYRKRSDNVPD